MQHFLRQGLSDGACAPFDESLGVARGGDPGDSQRAAAVQWSRLYVVTLTQVVEVLAGQVELLGVGLVWQHLFAAELGGDHLGVDHVPVLPGDVAPHRVVPGEGSVTVGTGHADPLVPLSDVSTQVCLVSVGSLAKWAFQFGSCNNKVKTSLENTKTSLPVPEVASPFPAGSGT